MKKINIIGASGTGKSTLAKALAAKLNIPHFDSDHFYHKPTNPPFRQQRSPEERFAMIMKDLGHRSTWVLSGAVGAWQPTPKLDYSLVVFLYLPPEIRLERLRQRELRLYGARITRAGDMEADHEYFMKWTAGYDSGSCEGTNTLGHHEAFLNGVKCPVVRIETPMTTEEQIRFIGVRVKKLKL